MKLVRHGLLVMTLGLLAATSGAQQQQQPQQQPQPPSQPKPSSAPSSGGLVDATRGPVPIPAATHPPPLRNSVNDDERVPRNYDMQPPIIPHRVDGYQVDKNFNKCLDCHARGKTEVSQAVPVSATHYVDRSGQVLPQISTRRYFCLQCHVPQDPVPPLVANRFRGIGAGADANANANASK
jgi:cytochrome c-type protein NapB